MLITGFLVRHNGTVKKIQVDVDKAVVKTGVAFILFEGLTSKAYAQSISESLNPIIDVLKDLAEPVSYGFMIKGFMRYMAGDEHEGMKTIKHAIGGFVGIQFIPQIFKILREIKF